MKTKIQIEIPEGFKEVIENSENRIIINLVKVDKEQEMRKFLKPFLTNLTIVHSEKYPDSVFYKQNGEVLFELNQYENTLYFYVRYDKIWSVFENKFGLSYDDIQSFIKKEVESTLKLKGVTPRYLKVVLFRMVESTLKLEQL